MAFKLVSRLDPAVIDVEPTASESYAYGECVKFANGKVTKAGGTDDIAGVTVAAYDGSGFGKGPRIIPAASEQIWEADYTGSPDNAFIPGFAAAKVNAAGTGVDATASSGGKISILSIDVARKKVLCKIKGRQLA